VLIDEPQQVSLGNLIFQAEIIKQGFGAVVLPHHDQQASDDQNQTKHGRMLSSNMLLPNLIPLIDVTFSTPTGDYTQNLTLTRVVTPPYRLAPVLLQAHPIRMHTAYPGTSGGAREKRPKDMDA